MKVTDSDSRTGPSGDAPPAPAVPPPFSRRLDLDDPDDFALAVLWMESRWAPRYPETGR